MIMINPVFRGSVRRRTPRIFVDGFCNEIADGQERHALVVDVSENGVRVERPFTGGRIPWSIQLELELPGVDEVIWARGDVCFTRVRKPENGVGGFIRTTGIRLAAAATRDLRLIRDYVMEVRRSRGLQAVAE